MKIKDELVLQGMTQAAADEIEYNTMGAFQTSDCNTHGYYIVKWTGNAYTLQEKCKCHAFDPPVIITEGELVCPAKFMTPMIKTSHWSCSSLRWDNLPSGHQRYPLFGINLWYMYWCQKHFSE